jgi:hypothetical protein
VSTTTAPPPNRVSRAYSFTDHSTHKPSVPHPGDRLDEEFDALYGHAQFTRALLDNIFTPAGHIRPHSVGIDHLDPDIRQILFDDIRYDLTEQLDHARAQTAYANAAADRAHQEAGRATQMAIEASQALSQVNDQADDAIQARADVLHISRMIDDQALETENFANDAEASANRAHNDQELAGAWAEYLEGNEPIPAMFFDHTGITGQHWSSRFWAIKAAGAFGSLAELYLGVHPTPPTSTNTGDPIPIGAIYYNSVSGQPYVWNGTEWVPFYAPTKALTLSLIYQATAGQTVFNLTSPDLAANVYSIDATTPEPLDVYLNGVRLPSNQATAGLGDWTLDPVTSVLTLASPTKAGDLIHIDVLTPAADLAPSRVQTLTLMDFDIDPVTDLPGQINGTRTVFPLMLVGPPHVPVSVNSAQELFVSVDGVVQQPGIDFSTIGGNSIAFAEAPTTGAKAWAQWYGANDLDMGTGSGGFGGMVSIRQFGASPANTPEQNVLAFQAAMDYGGLIYVDAGEYLINYYVTPRSHCTLMGAGIGKTILTRTGIPDEYSQPGCIFRQWAYAGLGQPFLEHFTVSDMTLQSDTMGVTGIFAQVIWDHTSSNDVTFARCRFCPVPGTEETAYFNSFLGVTGDYAIAVLKDHLIIDCIFENVHRLVIEMLNQHAGWGPEFSYAANTIVNPIFWPYGPPNPEENYWPPYDPVPHKFDYLVREPGTTAPSDGSEAAMPDWPLVVGQTVTDGTAVFECIPKQFNIQNHRTIRCTFKRNLYGWAHSFSGPAKGCLVKDCVFEEGCCNPGMGVRPPEEGGGYYGGTMVVENAGCSWSVWEGNKFYNWGRSNAIQSSEEGTYMTGNIYRNNIFIVTDDKQPDYVGAGDWNGSPIGMAYNHQCQVIDNYMYLGFGGGIGARDCDELYIHGNWIRALGENVNGFENSHNCIFSDNFVTNLGCPVPSQSAVIFWAGASHNLATGNIFKIKAGSIKPGAWDATGLNNQCETGNWLDFGTPDTPGTRAVYGLQGQPRSVTGYGASPGGDPGQNAIAFSRAAQAGGEIWVPKGVYDIDGTILPAAGAKFIGDGIDQTVLRSVGTGYDRTGLVFRLFTSAPCIGFGIENMTLRCDTPTIAATPLNLPNGLIWVEREVIADWQIKRVKFVCEANHVENPAVPGTHFGTGGITLFTDRPEKTMRNIVIEDCVFEGCSGGGIGISGATPYDWNPTTLYTAGSVVVPAPLQFRVTVAGTSGPAEPTWPNRLGATVGSGGATMVAERRTGAALFSCNKPYIVGDVVAPTVNLNPVDFLVIQEGTTGATHPTWPTTPGNPDGSNDITDGTCVFRAIAPNITVSDVTIQRCTFSRIGVWSWGSNIGFSGRAERININECEFGPTVMLAPSGGSQIENAGFSHSVIRRNAFKNATPRLSLRVVTSPPYINSNLYVENEFEDLSASGTFMDIRDDHDSTFARNTIKIGNAVLAIWDCVRMDIRDNLFQSTSDLQIDFWHPTKHTIRNNVFDNSKHVSNFAPLRFNAGSECLVTGNVYRLAPGGNRGVYLDGTGVNHVVTDGNYDAALGGVTTFSGYVVDRSPDGGSF